MKANEFRVTNLILDWSDRVCVVHRIDYRGNVTLSTIDFDGYNWETFSVTDTKPIPLTEEWLERLGFEKQMAWTWTIPITGGKSLVYYVGEKGWSIGNKEYSDHECRYVHQLQNLFFVLTGKELTIKEA